MNKPKAIGTKFESACVKKFKAAGFQSRRLALAGINDQGDVEIVGGHGVYAVECKCHKSWTRTDVEEWRLQTEREARSYWKERHAVGSRVRPILIVSQYNKSLDNSYVHIQRNNGVWIQMYLDEFVDYIVELEGEYNGG